MDGRNGLNLIAYFDNLRQPLTEAIDSLADFGRSIEGELGFSGNWVYSRTDQEAQTNTGFNPVLEPETYLSYLKDEHAKQTASIGDVGAFGENYSLKLPHASPSPPSDPYAYFDVFQYEGGLHPLHSDRLLFGSEITRGPFFLDLHGWARLTELIVAWRVPRYIQFEAYLYELEGRVHKHRAWGGWLGWVSQHVDAKDMPSGAVLIPIGTGTFVASQRAQLQSEDPEQLKQAQQVELALVELGVLPAKDELLRTSR